ncbi:MAG: oxidoreductase [Bdellovibrionaceae bacterium]|nr:oxidoreductase [Pseudobdellovibrionaceae bacterium]|tara:strand:+ start:1236 stop:2177 length:942 start_codon:yes stop_codon:yes gene_type:complete
MKNQVPELSLKSYMDGNEGERRLFINQLFEGLKKYGFIVLKDHPIDTDLLRKSYALSEELFSLNTSQKESYSDGEQGGQRGYIPFGKEHAKDSPFPDLKEFWHVGRDLPEDHRLKDQFPNNIWPKEVEGFKDTFQAMFKALDDTGRIMLEALTYSLDVPKDYFQKMTEAGSSILRLLHYPPIPEGANPNSIRAAAHEDINLITLLVSAQGAGLELLTREGEWIPVETAPENIIVDSGDMLARITNDVIPATTHRVVNPKGENKSRYSMPFFMHPNPDATLECLASCQGSGAKYPPILANDFLMERLREIGLIK